MTADRTISESRVVGGWCLWGFAILWCLFSIPLAFIVEWKLPMDARTLLMAAFPVAGALLVLVALYQTLRRRKYGTSLLRLEQVPVPLGATCRGELEVRMREMPASGFALRLACVRRTVSGSGKSRSVHEHVLWQDEQTVTHGPMPSPAGMRVPFRFDIPWECEPEDRANASDMVIWKLIASADVPGIDYEAAFELPVFRPEGGRDELAPRVHSVAAWQPPREITVDPDAIVVRSPSGFGDWIAFVLFYPIWFGALALVHRFGVPIYVVGFFALFSVLIAWFIVDFLIGRTRLSVARSTLTIRRTWLGLGRTITIPAAEITSLEPRIGSTFGNRGFHDVHAVLRSGRTRAIAKHIRNRRDAEMLAERVAQMLGL